MKYSRYYSVFLLLLCCSGGVALRMPTLTPRVRVLAPNSQIATSLQTIVPIHANATSTSLQAHNSQWYRKFFDVAPKEIPKFLSLSFMMFWIVFIFTMTRDTKDTLIVTNCGAEAIAFLKVYGVLPAAALFMMAYAKMASHLQPKV